MPTELGRIELEIRCDRHTPFDPQLIAKDQRRFPGASLSILGPHWQGLRFKEPLWKLSSVSYPAALALGGTACLAETERSHMFDEPGFPREIEWEEATLPTLYQFVYCSRAADGVDDAEVGRIVERAQRHNFTRGITGVLVFGSGVFFQWIEGPPGEIQKLIASLHGDPRHYDIVSLDQSEEERERLYPNWDMERVEAEGIRAVLQDALESAEDQTNVAALTRILKHLDSGPLGSLGRS